MQAFDIVKKSEPKKTFRVQSVIDRFDLQSDSIKERFAGQINVGDDWQVGLIVGASGTGKTTIARHIFGDDYYEPKKHDSDAVINELGKDKTIEQVTSTLNAVGFSSPPSWLKPYDVLSNGEKMRVDLADAILSDSKRVVFDEFTSVVDRQVARVGSFATQKAIRRTDKQFIAVGCHFDIEDWLMPDWVYSTDQMKLIYEKRRYLQRPAFEFRIYDCNEKSKHWKVFSRYHYLSHSHNNVAKVYVATINDEIAGFCSVLHFPHPKVKDIKRIHRLVVLPDYQGCGLGSMMLKHVCELYPKNRMRLVTSQPALIFGLKKSDSWKLLRKGRTSKSDGMKSIKGTTAEKRITTSWEYKHD
jgi:ABC-type ATPase with predicted acetyltransferase domain